MSSAGIPRRDVIHELTEREKRWPLVYGWPKYFALKRKGVVK